MQKQPLVLSWPHLEPQPPTLVQATAILGLCQVGTQAGAAKIVPQGYWPWEWPPPPGPSCLLSQPTSLTSLSFCLQFPLMAKVKKKGVLPPGT